MLTGAFILLAVGGLLWLAYRRPLPRRWVLPRKPARVPAAAVAAVDRQHRHLQAGGLIGEAAFGATKTRFQELLAAGQYDAVDGELHPGLEFAVRVRALTEIGTPEAGYVLERQLGRHLTADPVERAWYWVDVAAGLRRLNHTDALPAVLRCADDAAGLPQGTVLAAEAVGFPNFPAALHNPDSPSARSAIRALAKAARGCRDGTIDPAAMVRAGIGDHLAAVAETAPPAADPWLTAVVLEAERVARRLGHWAKLLAPDARPLAERQALRLESSAGRRAGWLGGTPRRLLARFPEAAGDEATAILSVLADLRVNTARLFTVLPDRRQPWWPDAVRCLTWATAPAIGPMLAYKAGRYLASPKLRPAALVLLEALRGHRCPEAEAVLLKAAAGAEPATRRAAASSLGWWEPFDTRAVVRALRAGRADPDPAVRRSATAALARLGERAALHEFTEALASEEPAIRQLTALTVAEEGLTWLWPDLEAQADGPDPDTALFAVEALERLRERIVGATS